MIRNVVRALALACLLGLALVSQASAQNVICSTAPPNDSSNRCASTAFVHSLTPPGQYSVTCSGNISATLAAAITTASSAGYGDIHIGGGSCTAKNITVPSNIRIFLSGDTTLGVPTGSVNGDSLFNVRGDNAGVFCQGGTLAATGSNTAAGPQTVIDIRNAANNSVLNCRWQDVPFIAVNIGSASVDALVSGNVFTATSQLFPAVWVSALNLSGQVAPSNPQVINNRFVGTAVQMQAVGGLVSGNYFTSPNLGAAIISFDSRELTFGFATRGLVVTANVIDGVPITAAFDGSGIELHGTENTVTSNYIANVAVNGITLHGGSGSTVTGNTIKNCGQATANSPGIAVAATNRSINGLTVSGNTITDDQGSPTCQNGVELVNGGNAYTVSGLSVVGNVGRGLLGQFVIVRPTNANPVLGSDNTFGPNNGGSVTNTVSGVDAGIAIGSASFITTYGNLSCASIATVAGTSCFGAQAGLNSTGPRNLFLGGLAGSNMGSATDSIIIGYNAQGIDNTTNFQLNIGGAIRGNLSTQILTFPGYTGGIASLSTAGLLANTSISALVLGNGTSAPSAYAGTSCTNQFPRSLNGSGVATCASVVNADISGLIGLAHGALNLDLTATGGTSKFVRQNTLGGAMDVVRPSCADLSDAGTGCTGSTGASAVTALTGDVSATGPGSVAATLATVNANTGSWGSSTAIPNFTVDGKGRITAAGTNVVIAPAGTLTGATLAANVLASSLTSVGTLTGGATGAGFTVALGTSTVTGRLAFANLTQCAGLSLLGVTGSATADLACITGTAGQVPRINAGGTGFLFGLVPAASIVTGTSGANIPLLSGSANTWSGRNIFTSSAGTIPLQSTADATSAIGFDIAGRASDSLAIFRFVNNAVSVEGGRFSWDGGSSMLLQAGSGVALFLKANAGAATGLTIDTANAVTASVSFTSGSWVKLTPTTVGTLPTCNAGAKATISFVTDASATTFWSTAAGGGANNIKVTCDGTNWKIGALRMPTFAANDNQQVIRAAA